MYYTLFQWSIFIDLSKMTALQQAMGCLISVFTNMPRARDLNFTLVTFWIFLAVKCPLESISKPYGRATTMPTALGLNNASFLFKNLPFSRMKISRKWLLLLIIFLTFWLLKCSLNLIFDFRQSTGSESWFVGNGLKTRPNS